MMSSDHADSSALSYDVVRSELNIIISEEVLMIPRNFILVYIQVLIMVMIQISRPSAGLMLGHRRRQQLVQIWLCNRWIHFFMENCKSSVKLGLVVNS